MQASSPHSLSRGERTPCILYTFASPGNRGCELQDIGSSSAATSVRGRSRGRGSIAKAAVCPRAFPTSIAPVAGEEERAQPGRSLCSWRTSLKENERC
uniref:Uncharacterized protein n=1 Tax=Accipiter nisus TaxID=211598 RepID=A0A8B9M715_9AVES